MCLVAGVFDFVQSRLCVRERVRMMDVSRPERFIPGFVRKLLEDMSRKSGNSLAAIDSESLKATATLLSHRRRRGTHAPSQLVCVCVCVRRCGDRNAKQASSFNTIHRQCCLNSQSFSRDAEKPARSFFALSLQIFHKLLRTEWTQTGIRPAFEDVLPTPRP